MAAKRGTAGKRRGIYFAYSCALGFGSLFFVAMLWGQPFLLACVLLAIAGAMVYPRGDLNEVALFILCGISGTIAEAIGILGGAWHYEKPFAFGIPLWLPILWGIAAIFMHRFYLRILP